MKQTAQRGFTLLELIMVIVIVALASVPILGQFTQASSSMLLDGFGRGAAAKLLDRAHE